MKYDDASWHYNESFPKDSPQDFSGTHIAILLKWCFLKGWAGELHINENPDDVEKVINGTKSATDFFFQWCDGKFTDEDLTAEGNAFVSDYYENHYTGDYAGLFADKMFVAPESEHDLKKMFELIDMRYSKYMEIKSGSKPWWKIW